MANLNDTIVNGNITATGKIVKSGGTSTQFLMADGSVKEEASIGNGTYVKKTGDTMTGGLVINKSGNEANVPLIVGGNKTNISLSVTSTPGYTSGMVIQAGGGSATAGSYIGFHNPNTSSATIGYKNSDANNGIFRFMSDSPYWDVSIGGSKKLAGPWGKANLLVGDDGADKAVIGYLTNRMTGLVVGSHNSNLDAWAALNLSGSTVNILNEENTIMTVNASGATLKGTLTINNDIIYKGTNSSSNIIKFIDNTGDQWGNGIAIGGGGPTIIGGGEAADEIRNNVTVNGGAEIMAIGNDGDIDFYSNCQDGFSSAKHMTFDTSGNLNVPSTVQGTASSNRLIFRHLDGQNCGGNYDLYLQYHENQRNSRIYLNGTTYYIENGSYYNGTASAANTAGYATTAHLLRTYSASDASHGEDYYLKCRHNVDGNDRFKLQIVRTDGTVTHSTSVDYANSAGSVGGFKFVVDGSVDMNDATTYNTDGAWVARGVSNGASGNHSFVMNFNSLGTPFQLEFPDSTIDYIYKRHRTAGTTSWSEWRKISAGYADSAGNADTLDGKHSSDFYLSSSNITNLPINGGIYWNPYVESSTDGSDAASITVIKDGNGNGGTVLQIKQANDNNDIVNVVAGDLKLNGVSVSTNGHTHTKSQITDFSHTHTKSEVGLGNVDNTADAIKNVNYANSAGSVAWDNISSKPITITQRNNSSPVSGAYAYGTYITMRNTNNWLEIYAPHMGTSSSRVYMQTGWDNDRQGWKAIAWTSDIPTVNNATLTIQRNGTNVATFTANSSTDKIANILVPNPTDYYWANVKISSTSSTSTSPTFDTVSANEIHCDNFYPKQLSGDISIGSSSGAGSDGAAASVYVYACDTILVKTTAQDGDIIIDADGETSLTGYAVSLKAYNDSVTFNSTSQGWQLSQSDYTGNILPGGNNFGYIGKGTLKFYYMFTSNLGSSSYPVGSGHFTNLYKGGSSVSTSDIRLKNNIKNTTLEALPIIKNIHVLNYQLNDFTKEQEKLKKEKEKARKALAKIPKTKENKKKRKELQEIISTPNLSKFYDIGVSAQELESLLPKEYKETFITKESTHNFPDQRYIKDDNLIYLLMKAIQEQQQIIESLEKRIDTMEDSYGNK